MDDGNNEQSGADALPYIEDALVEGKDDEASEQAMSHEEVNAIFRDAREMMAKCGPSAHDQAVAAITVLIFNGIDTTKRIMGALKRLGFNAQHAGIILSSSTGNDPARHRWSVDAGANYRLH